MNKNIILSALVASTLFTTILNASTIEERIAKLEAIINAQQKEIKELKIMAEDVDEIDERLETVETRSFTDKIKFGLAMRVEANNISTTYANGTNPKEEDTIWRTKLNLNMKAKISDNLKFSGRLSSYKNWGDSNTNTGAYATIDSRQGRTPDNSSALYVERAYLDWIINPNGTIPVIMTLGRQPSSDGPSYQIKEGMSRKGTYDALAFDGAADGIVLTTNLEKVLSGTSARIAYGVPANTSNNTSPTASVVDTKVTGLFIDKSFSGIGKTNLMQVYHVISKDFNADSSGTGTGTTDINVGDFDLTGIMFEVSGLSNFDFFAHYAKSLAKPNGKSMLGADGNYYGLLSTNSGATNGSTSNKKGQAFWLGARYNLKDWAFGAEYNKGSENWFSFTYAPSDPMNKLATRGDATELYISKKINKYANIRAGFMKINYDYTNSGSHLGKPETVTDGLGTKAIKEKTNTYVTFNVLF